MATGREPKTLIAVVVVVGLPTFFLCCPAAVGVLRFLTITSKEQTPKDSFTGQARKEPGS